MSDPLRLTATLVPRGPAGAFVLSDEQAAALGEGRRAFPVQLTVNGTTVPLRLSRMGGENLVGLNKAVRAAVGVSVGDVVDVELALDAAERSVDVPADLQAALDAEPPVAQAFSALAASHRKEYVRWVTEAKREATRADRVAKTVEMVREGRTR